MKLVQLLKKFQSDQPKWKGGKLPSKLVGLLHLEGTVMKNFKTAQNILLQSDLGLGLQRENKCSPV
jgi:hypothetical protein